ncbi:MAG TPA: hypothetical protein VID93_09810 [Acidimicrobiales bacterium]
MWAKRIGAVVAAVALVGGAILLRRAVDGGSGSGGSSSTDPPAGKTAVVCIPELEAACQALAAADDGLALTIEPAGTTYERVVADPTSAPAVWVTLDPWPQMVSSAVAVSGADDPFPAGGAPVAISDLVMVGRTPRMAALQAHCGTTTWRCIGEAAGQPWEELGGEAAWGVLKPSHADAAESAVGLLSFATIVTDYWGSADYTGTDLQNDDAFLSWLGRLEGAIPTYGDAANTPLSIMLSQPRIDVVGTTAAEIRDQAGAQAGDLTGAAPAGPVPPLAQVVVAGDDHAQAVWTSAALRDGLNASSWKAPSTGSPELPAGTGLPPPDVMIALRDLWQGVAKR